jgi:FlaA1/EpsC-like NDP-sugar epimerase
MVSSVLARRAAVVAWDVGAWVFAMLAFVLVRHDLSLSERVWQAAVAYTIAAIVLQVVGGFRNHLYLGRSKIGSFDEATALGTLVAGIALVLGVIFYLTQPVFSRGLAVAMPSLAFLVMAAGRWVLRALILGRATSVSSTAAPALIYGAGDAGHQVARLVDTADEPPYRIVGFIDDDPAKRFLRVRSHRVLGVGEDLVDKARSSGAQVVILAISQAEPKFIQALADRCSSAGLQLVVVPPVREMIAGQVELDKLREFNVADLLGRRPVTTDLREIAGYVNGKVVLVTGAGGSIGSELARQVHDLQPGRLVLLDRDESALHAAQLSLYGSGLLDRDDLVLCDIRDFTALDDVFAKHRPDVVFHAAALKHLPMLERYPEEGWKTNVIGSLNVLRCARAHGVRHFVNISTDKAADATSVLGQTKRLSERLTSWYAHDTGMPYISVRFGNVLGSRGSVLDAFRAQIDRGGPVTVTHPDVTRFFMTIPEACELVLQSGAIGQSGDVLVLDMGEPVRIVDVARRLIDESHRSVDIEYTGLRHGEKLHEVLLSANEQGTPSRHPLITQVSVPPLDPVEVLVDDAAIDHIGPLLRRQMSAGVRPPEGGRRPPSDPSW